MAERGLSPSQSNALLEKLGGGVFASPTLIDHLNREFHDILSDGKVRQTELLPDESDEPDTLHLHRLLVHFNRQDFARLRQMIDVINQED